MSFLYSIRLLSTSAASFSTLTKSALALLSASEAVLFLRDSCDDVDEDDKGATAGGFHQRTPE